MELQDITKEGEGNEEDKGASKPKLEVKIEEEAEPDLYCKLESPAEDVYSEAFFGGDPGKTRAGKQTEGNTRLYRAACLVLTIMCLILLLLVIILCVKLQTGSTICPAREETTAADVRNPPFDQTCSHEKCLALFPSTQAQRVGCQQCPPRWLNFDRSCFYLSTSRLSWDESQRNCSASGGSLAVVSSQRLQSFLTKEGKMKYWIGLRHQGATWTWVNNTVLRQSYWKEGVLRGDCGILSSEFPPEKNWIRAACEGYSYFICQLQL